MLPRAAAGPLVPFSEAQSLQVKQLHELGEIVFGYESRNRYEVFDETGRRVAYAHELGSGLFRLLMRGFLASRRPFTIDLLGDLGERLLEIRRPWRWWLSRAEVYSGDGRFIGAIQQKFTIFSRKFVVEDATGRELAEIHGPLFQPWTFELQIGGREVGVITKKWSGLLREAFTDADNFGLQFRERVDRRLPPLCLGATFLIDFLYFESSR